MNDREWLEETCEQPDTPRPRRRGEPRDGETRLDPGDGCPQIYRIGRGWIYLDEDD